MAMEVRRRSSRGVTASLQLSVEVWSTESDRDSRKELALHDARDQAAHGPEVTRSRVRERLSASPDPSPDGEADSSGDLDLTAAIHAARAGDEDAFVVVWRTLHPPLLRYLRVRGDDGTEDLASETWLQVLRSLETFVGDAREFRAWLFTIARNRAVDAGRARTRRPSVPVADVTELRPETHRHAAPSAEDVALDNDGTARALRLVASLPAAQAEMVMLRVVAGLDVADVAELLGKKPGTVRVTVHRALQSLARDQRASREVV
jgi:RNA polymerase sigma-70 factor (ECF subfamily)